jgi:hypothetical protein
VKTRRTIPQETDAKVGDGSTGGAAIASEPQWLAKLTSALERIMESKMKWPLLMVGVVAVAVAATLLPIRSSKPPILLSDADGVEWKCSKSALILTTCMPNHEVGFLPR